MAGKTGTTENYGDAWFVGWTREITVAVWVGYPDELRPMETEFAGEPVAGGTYPALIFKDFVEQAMDLGYVKPEEEEEIAPVTPVTPVGADHVRDARPRRAGARAAGARTPGRSRRPSPRPSRRSPRRSSRRPATEQPAPETTAPEVPEPAEGAAAPP